MRAMITLASLSLLCLFTPRLISGILFFVVTIFLFRRIFDEQCSKSRIEYVTMDGAVFGYERSKKVIPWDPDIDVVMPPTGWTMIRAAEEIFRNAGLGLGFAPSPHMIIVFLLERPKIYSPVEMRRHNHSWPHIEVSELFESEGSKVAIDGKGYGIAAYCQAV
jgi:hypothetical protein